MVIARIKHMRLRSISVTRGLPQWLCSVFLVLLWAATGRLDTAKPDRAGSSSTPTMGQLKIEGDAVERVALAKRTGPGDAFDSVNPIVLQRPGASVSLPAGEYLLRLIELRGGYRCDVPVRIVDGWTNKVLREPEWLTISPSKPCLLKIGAPLKPTVRVVRYGRVIHLGYELLDAEGRRYAREELGKPPRFTVSCNGREVASGSFEYG